MLGGGGEGWGYFFSTHDFFSTHTHTHTHDARFPLTTHDPRQLDILEQAGGGLEREKNLLAPIHYAQFFLFVSISTCFAVIEKREIVKWILHLPEVNKNKTRYENRQQILENIGYGLGVTP